MNFSTLLNAMPGAVAQGLIWGVMAIGLYITYKVLDYADLTVDGTMATGGAVCIMLMMQGVNTWVALLCAFIIYWVLGGKRIGEELVLGRKKALCRAFLPTARYLYVGLAVLVFILSIICGGIG